MHPEPLFQLSNKSMLSLFMFPSAPKHTGVQLLVSNETMLERCVLLVSDSSHHFQRSKCQSKADSCHVHGPLCSAQLSEDLGTLLTKLIYEHNIVGQSQCKSIKANVADNSNLGASVKDFFIESSPYI